MTTFILRHGDVPDCLREIPCDTFQCVVTSPPYWGLRDYGLPPSVWGGDPEHAHEWGEVLPPAKSGPGNKPGEFSTSSLTNPARQNAIHAVANKKGDAGSLCVLCGAWRGCLGLEPTPELYIEHMVTVFREVRRVLRPDGTLWLNIGDSYATNTGPNGGGQGPSGQRAGRTFTSRTKSGQRCPAGYKPKDLIGIPWMLAFALRADGWYLRSEIIWHKPNPMPESVTDRPTKAHETIFLLSKEARYFYDAEAIAEPAQAWTGQAAVFERTGPVSEHVLPGQGYAQHRQSRAKGNAKTFRGGGAYTGNRSFDNSADVERESHGNAPNEKGTRNKRSVWTIATRPFPEAHFATFPEEIPRICIRAGSRPGDVVLDPFSGAGTTGVAAIALDRDYLGIELNPEYLAMSRRRLESVAPMFAKEAL